MIGYDEKHSMHKKLDAQSGCISSLFINKYKLIDQINLRYLFLIVS